MVTTRWCGGVRGASEVGKEVRCVQNEPSLACWVVASARGDADGHVVNGDGVAGHRPSAEGLHVPDDRSLGLEGIVALHGCRVAARNRRIGAACGGIAGPGRVAGVLRPADDRARTVASAGLTYVVGEARVAPRARRAVGRRNARARSGGRIAGAGDVAGVARRAAHRVRPDARPARARERRVAEVVAGAGRAVGRGRAGALPGGGIAGAGDVAGVARVRR